MVLLSCVITLWFGCLPTQFVANRKVEGGDIVVAEISAAFWEYPGQVLRSFAVGAEPPMPLSTPLPRSDGAMPQQIIDAASVIEQAGFTIIDDLLHGYGGGYLPPVLGSRSRPSASYRRAAARRNDGRDSAECGYA
jgi:hypothetical protein